MPVAYSYRRFSSPKQAAGDSIRRQTETRDRWLRDHPDIPLDKSLALTDRGRSAYKRDNWETYALAEFVRHVESGRVRPGDYLLVENLDRLSREKAGRAVELFLSIVNRGVVIVQLMPAVLEFRDPVDTMQLMFAIVELSRGYSESAAKSERCRAAWHRKNGEAKTRVVTSKLPGWVRYDRDAGRLVLDPDAAAVVRRMYALARDGQSATAIALTLNGEGVPVLGRRVVKGRAVVWSAPVVHQILTSRAAVGEYVPYRWTRRQDKPTAEAVPGYYPAAIDRTLFEAVRGALAVRCKVGRGRRGKHVNLFAGLLKDCRDGGSLSYCHRKDSSSLIPVSAKHGSGLPVTSFPAVAFERALRSRLVEVKAADIAGDDVAGRKVDALIGRKAELEKLIAAWKRKMDNPDIVDTVAWKLAELSPRLKAVADELAAARREAASPVAEAWGEFRTLAGLNPDDDTDDLRVKIRAALRRSLAGVWCLFTRAADGTRLTGVRVVFQGGAVRSYLIGFRQGYANGKGLARPGHWWVRSFVDAAPGADALDLRRPDHARRLAKVLERLELTL